MALVRDAHLLQTKSYEEYLDSFITNIDLRYLGNKHFARMLVKLGYRSTNEILTKEMFEIKRDIIREVLYPTKKGFVYFSEGLDIKDPVLHELAIREAPNYQKVISTIIFVQYRTKGGFEITGYIDFEHSLKKANMQTEDAVNWQAIFAGKKKLIPQPTDLSYHHWRTDITKYNESQNYKVLLDPVEGLTFVHRGDRKFVCVKPGHGRYSKNASRTMVFSDKYNHVILYDHLIRRKI